MEFTALGIRRTEHATALYQQIVYTNFADKLRSFCRYSSLSDSKSKLLYD
jgi:hypothetical protein